MSNTPGKALALAAALTDEERRETSDNFYEARELLRIKHETDTGSPEQEEALDRFYNELPEGDCFDTFEYEKAISDAKRFTLFMLSKEGPDSAAVATLQHLIAFLRVKSMRAGRAFGWDRRGNPTPFDPSPEPKPRRTRST